MKTKTLVTVLLVTIVLISCAPATTSVPPTETAVPTVTFTVPARTSTPTQIPPTPTETKPSNADFLAASENSFPLKEVDGLAEYICTADFSNIIYTKYESPGETQILSWVLCEDGGKTFLVPTHYVNHDIAYWPMALAGSTSNDGSDIIFDEAGIKGKMNRILAALNVTGKKAKVKLLIGKNSGSILRFADLFPRLYAATNWDEATQKFMLSGNPDDLPSVPGFSQKLLLAVRIIIVDPN